MWRICLILWLSGVSGASLALTGPEARALAWRAARSLDHARSAAARGLLDQIERSSDDPGARMHARILRARIRFEAGAWVGSMHLLRRVIDSASLRCDHPDLLAEAYLQYAEVCRSFLWLERYHRVTDTVGMLVRSRGLPDSYRARYFTNKVLYFSIQVMNDKAVPFVDTLQGLLDRADPRERYRYRPVMATVAMISFHRNKRHDLAADIGIRARRDSDTADHLFDRIALWRAMGNHALDSAREGKTTRKTREALECFAHARGLIDRHYPGNDMERLALYNLSGLTLQFAGDYKRAAAFFEQSDAILRQARYPLENYVWAHTHTSLWKLPIIDSVYSGRRLEQEQMMQLARFQRLARVWDQWRDINRIDSLGFYRNPYSTEPLQVVVRLCHGLYRDSRHPRWIDTAFQAQERSKYPELCQRLMGRAGLTHRPMPPTLSELRSRLRSDEALLSFSESFSALHILFAVVLTRDTAAFLRFDTSALASILEAADRYPDHSPTDIEWFKRTYHRAYQHVFHRIEGCMGASVKVLQVLPSSMIASFQMEMMLPDTAGVDVFRKLRFFGDRYAIRYDHSWTVAELRRRLPPPDVARQDMVFVPLYAPTPEFSLPFFESQARTLARDYGFRIFEGEDCSLANFARSADRARILQVSAHGHPSKIYAGDQYIALDGHPDAAGAHLYPTHLLARRLDADLAVLAICEGGISEFRIDIVHNFMYWFTYAGARSCLYSQWKLDDRSTAYILDRFYDHLTEGMGRSDALRLAKADYRAAVRSDEEMDPVYWAGLTLIGDDAPLPLAPRALRLHALALAAAVGLGLGLFWRYRRRLTRAARRPAA